MTERPEITTVADAPPGNWVDTMAPSWFRPYAHLARLDRPIGWWLLLWPCWWSLALASGAAGDAFPSPWVMALFLIGAVVMRGAGCTYNDILDRDIDPLVARTRLRPIPSGRVTARQAAVFMVLLSLIGLLVLVQFNRFAIGLGIASLAIVAVYPLMKRLTGHPQVVLGLAFAWGGLMGWAVVFGSLAAPAILIYGAAIAWTVGYDTIYAHQDREDDALIGLGSTAITYGERSGRFLALCYGAAMALLLAALAVAVAGVAAYAGAAAFAAHLAWQVHRFDMNDPALCLALFRSNREAGWLLFAGLVADSALRHL
jgi:4-hydroxybenzoate polyprenyltransferase